MSINFQKIAQAARSRINPEDWMTVKEAAEREGISRNMIYWLLKNKKIPGSVKFGTQYLIMRKWNYEKKSPAGARGLNRESALALENPDPWFQIISQAK